MENLRSFIETENNLAENFLNGIRGGDVLVLVGAGRAFPWYVRWLKDNNVEANYVIDNGLLIGDCVMGVPVIDFNRAKELSNNSSTKYIISAPKYKDELIKELKNKIGENIEVYSFEAEIYYTFLRDIEKYRKTLSINYERIEDLYEVLADEKSKQTLISFVKGRVTGNQFYFEQMMNDDQYFPEIITMNESEVIVEVGSNNGETLKDILSVTKRKYNKIYCFEPDLNCVEVLEEVVNTEKNIELITKGLGSRAERVYFYSDAELGASRVVESKEKCSYYIDITTLDEIIENCTYLKMDVEGMELDVIKGGRNLIIKNKPKLAICVYHKELDFLDIPEYLLKIRPDYKLYLRHHNYGATETVLYAV